MKKEVNALKKLECWKEIKCINDAKVLHTNFVLKLNRNQGGTIEKYKARLVIGGNEKEEHDIGLFSPAVQFNMIKPLLCLTMQNN